MLGNPKMSVVPRHGAQKFDLVKLAPRCAPQDTVSHSAGNCVVHHIQAGISEDDHVILRHLHHIGKKLLRLSDTVQAAVIAAVHAIRTGQVHTAVEHIHHPH